MNTTGTNLSLGAGQVSSAISKAGGDTLQDECKSKAPNGVEPGEIVVTTGGNMECQNVYHGALVCWQGTDGGDAPKVIQFLFI